jgi:DNA-binding NarL/FixJ family response regulator
MGAATDSDEHSSGPREDPRQQRPRLTVLVIEDDFGDFDAVFRALKRSMVFEFVTSRARTMREARHLTASQHFDVALVDFNLGLETGLHFFRENGGRLGGILTILLSGSPSPDVQRAALEAGAIACINKADVSATLLESTIRSAQHTRMLEQQLYHVLTELERARHQPPAASAFAPLRILVERLEDRAARMPAAPGGSAEVADLRSLVGEIGSILRTLPA